MLFKNSKDIYQPIHCSVWARPLLFSYIPQYLIVIWEHSQVPKLFIYAGRSVQADQGLYCSSCPKVSFHMARLSYNHQGIYLYIFSANTRKHMHIARWQYTSWTPSTVFSGFNVIVKAKLFWELGGLFNLYCSAYSADNQFDNSFLIFPLTFYANSLLFMRPGPSCSKLTTSLVNDSLKFTSSDSQICWNF